MELIQKKLEKEYLNSEIFGVPPIWKEQMSSLMRSTNGEVAPKELGYFLKRFGYRNTLEAYIVWYGLGDDEQIAFDRWKFVSSLLHGKEKDAETISRISK